MKRIVLFSILFGFASTALFAQDDMYFTPKKSKAKEAKTYEQPAFTTFSSTFRDVDEYNRQGRFDNLQFGFSSDTLYSDVIDFSVDTLDMIDTAYVADKFNYEYDPEEDYAYSRAMSRYDDFYWYDPWYYGWYGYSPYWYGSPYWYSRWWWYDPWYYSWHRPVYWHYPSHWYIPAHRHYYYGRTGTNNRTRNYGNHRGSANRFMGRGDTNSGTRRMNMRGNSDRSNRNSDYNSMFGGQRQDSYNRQNTPSTGTYNNRSYSPNRSSGSFRSGGGSFGGSRGGGGSFGGRRR